MGAETSQKRTREVKNMPPSSENNAVGPAWRHLAFERFVVLQIRQRFHAQYRARLTSQIVWAITRGYYPLFVGISPSRHDRT